MLTLTCFHLVQSTTRAYLATAASPYASLFTPVLVPRLSQQELTQVVDFSCGLDSEQAASDNQPNALELHTALRTLWHLGLWQGLAAHAQALEVEPTGNKKAQAHGLSRQSVLAAQGLAQATEQGLEQARKQAREQAGFDPSMHWVVVVEDGVQLHPNWLQKLSSTILSLENQGLHQDFITLATHQATSFVPLTFAQMGEQVSSGQHYVRNKYDPVVAQVQGIKHERIGGFESVEPPVAGGTEADDFEAGKASENLSQGTEPSASPEASKRPLRAEVSHAGLNSAQELLLGATGWKSSAVAPAYAVRLSALLELVAEFSGLTELATVNQSASADKPEAKLTSQAWLDDAPTCKDLFANLDLHAVALSASLKLNYPPTQVNHSNFFFKSIQRPEVSQRVSGDFCGFAADLNAYILGSQVLTKTYADQALFKISFAREEGILGTIGSICAQLKTRQAKKKSAPKSGAASTETLDVTVDATSEVARLRNKYLNAYANPPLALSAVGADGVYQVNVKLAQNLALEKLYIQPVGWDWLIQWDAWLQSQTPADALVHQLAQGWVSKFLGANLGANLGADVGIGTKALGAKKLTNTNQLATLPALVQEFQVANADSSVHALGSDNLVAAYVIAPEGQEYLLTDFYQQPDTGVFKPVIYQEANNQHTRLYSQRASEQRDSLGNMANLTRGDEMARTIAWLDIFSQLVDNPAYSDNKSVLICQADQELRPDWKQQVHAALAFSEAVTPSNHFLILGTDNIDSFNLLSTNELKQANISYDLNLVASLPKAVARTQTTASSGATSGSSLGSSLGTSSGSSSGSFSGASLPSLTLSAQSSLIPETQQLLMLNSLNQLRPTCFVTKLGTIRGFVSRTRERVQQKLAELTKADLATDLVQREQLVLEGFAQDLDGMFAEGKLDRSLVAALGLEQAGQADQVTAAEYKLVRKTILAKLQQALVNQRTQAQVAAVDSVQAYLENLATTSMHRLHFNVGLRQLELLKADKVAKTLLAEAMRWVFDQRMLRAPFLSWGAVGRLVETNELTLKQLLTLGAVLESITLKDYLLFADVREGLSLCLNPMLARARTGVPVRCLSADSAVRNRLQLDPANSPARTNSASKPDPRLFAQARDLLVQAEIPGLAVSQLLNQYQQHSRASWQALLKQAFAQPQIQARLADEANAFFTDARFSHLEPQQVQACVDKLAALPLQVQLALRAQLLTPAAQEALAKIPPTSLHSEHSSVFANYIYGTWTLAQLFAGAKVEVPSYKLGDGKVEFANLAGISTQLRLGAEAVRRRSADDAQWANEQLFAQGTYTGVRQSLRQQRKLGRMMNQQQGVDFFGQGIRAKTTAQTTEAATSPLNSAPVISGIRQMPDYMAKVKKYLVSLDNAHDRRHFIYSQPHTEDVIWVPGVRGKLLSQQEVNVRFDRRGFWQTFDRYVTAGEIGCSLSHVKVMLQVLADADIGLDDWVMVIEDDTRLMPDWYQNSNRLIHYLEQDRNAPRFVQCQNNWLRFALPLTSEELLGCNYFSTNPQSNHLLTNQLGLFYPHGVTTYGSSHYLFKKSALISLLFDWEQYQDLVEEYLGKDVHGLGLIAKPTPQAAARLARLKLRELEARNQLEQKAAATNVAKATKAETKSATKSGSTTAAKDVAKNVAKNLAKPAAKLTQLDSAQPAALAVDLEASAYIEDGYVGLVSPQARQLAQSPQLCFEQKTQFSLKTLLGAPQRDYLLSKLEQASLKLPEQADRFNKLGSYDEQEAIERAVGAFTYTDFRPRPNWVADSFQSFLTFNHGEYVYANPVLSYQNLAFSSVIGSEREDIIAKVRQIRRDLPLYDAPSYIRDHCIVIKHKLSDAQIMAKFKAFGKVFIVDKNEFYNLEPAQEAKVFDRQRFKQQYGREPTAHEIADSLAMMAAYKIIDANFVATHYYWLIVDESVHWLVGEEPLFDWEARIGELEAQVSAADTEADAKDKAQKVLSALITTEDRQSQQRLEMAGEIAKRNIELVLHYMATRHSTATSVIEFSNKFFDSALFNALKLAKQANKADNQADNQADKQIAHTVETKPNSDSPASSYRRRFCWETTDLSIFKAEGVGNQASLLSLQKQRQESKGTTGQRRLYPYPSLSPFTQAALERVVGWSPTSEAGYAAINQLRKTYYLADYAAKHGLDFNLDAELTKLTQQTQQVPVAQRHLAKVQADGSASGAAGALSAQVAKLPALQALERLDYRALDWSGREFTQYQVGFNALSSVYVLVDEPDCHFRVNEWLEVNFISRKASTGGKCVVVFDYPVLQMELRDKPKKCWWLADDFPQLFKFYHKQFAYVNPPLAVEIKDEWLDELILDGTNPQ